MCVRALVCACVMYVCVRESKCVRKYEFISAEAEHLLLAIPSFSSFIYRRTMAAPWPRVARPYTAQKVRRRRLWNIAGRSKRD